MTVRHPLSEDLPSPDAAVFSARITPHRSMGQQGLRVVMTLVCLASVVGSVPFILAGAWPVAGFFGLDALALYVAFRINFRDARAFEEVAVSPLMVMLAKVSPAGQRDEWRFDTLFTKLELKLFKTISDQHAQNRPIVYPRCRV